ncbi:PIG-L deacetylase family protein [Jeotgalibacillus soli]|uniref:GlcNAc-PI de-N-acetylase n=1 Tax=Jeotgalibacillus soli TaxID=889306 RepID=A0A0C2W1Q9_9BACL|nr:PIG-L deacetylase family protein [Jeotgalibacillus soli]KIL50038.1 hypothetical protein KP78_15060 [Jeotgalibacillus soli]
MSKNILVIAAHPDDELLGLGGTLKKLIKKGYKVISVIMALGRKEEAHHIKKFVENANKHIGIEKVICLDYPNLEMESFALHTINKKIEALIKEYQPSMVFTHHYGDVNRDHQVTYQAVLTAVRPLPGTPSIDLICFETVSSSEWSQQTDDKTFKPNYFVEITDEIEDKIEALHHYDVEMRDFPHPRSYDGVRYLARVRGMTVGVPYAEAFEITRKIWR